MFDVILQNFLGGFAVFIGGFTLGYVVKALGGISGITADVATLKSDVTHLKLQPPLTINAPAPISATTLVS